MKLCGAGTFFLLTAIESLFDHFVKHAHEPHRTFLSWRVAVDTDDGAAHGALLAQSQGPKPGMYPKNVQG